LHQFDENHPELKGFSEYYQSEIEPVFYGLESNRWGAILSARKYSLILILITFGVMWYSHKINEPRVVQIALFLLGVFLVLSLFYVKKDFLKAGTKQSFVSAICNYVGWEFRSEPSVNLNLEVWQSLFLLPKAHEVLKVGFGLDVSIEDEITGQVHGAEFRSIEVELMRVFDSDLKWTFQGQLMSITFPRKFLGRTCVLRNKLSFQNNMAGDMKHVGLVDPAFQSVFKAYSTDQVEARYLLTPVFMETLMDLERSVNGQNIRFGFVGNQLLIAVETEDRFEIGSMSKTLMAPSRTQKILDEICAIYEVVDIVSHAKRG